MSHAEYTPFISGADLDKGTDPATFFTFFKGPISKIVACCISPPTHQILTPPLTHQPNTSRINYLTNWTCGAWILMKQIRSMKVICIYELVQTDGRPKYKSVVDLNMFYLRLD